MRPSRRKALQRIPLALAGLSAMPGAQAQSPAPWPSRPVRVVYPYPPGGTGDVALRMITSALAKAWGQPVIVENRPGAGGMIGADAVAKAAPDGHTLLFALTGLVQMPALYGKAPFDPNRDFAPIVDVATSHWALVVQPELPVRDLQGFVDHASKPDKPVPYGTFSLGSGAHLQMEIFARAARLALVHVPYKGEAPLLQDLLARQVPAGTVAATTALRHAGKLRTLAVAGGSRSPLLPDVPTFGEAGIPGMERQGFAGIFGPAGTPSGVQDKVAGDVSRALSEPDIRARMLELGFVLRGHPPSAFAETVRAEHEYWTATIRAAGIRLDQ